MKKLLIITCLSGSFNMINAQPPGSPKDMPGTDTSTIEMDSGKRRDKQTVQRSDTAKMVPNGPKRRKNN